MASLRRHRRGIAEAEDYDDGSTDTTTATDEEEEEEEEDHRSLHLGLHSMTAKVHLVTTVPTNACHHGGMNSS
jgi:Ran GTPase-activating protein (RanGAP) involved in mRNA processing and transport